MVTIDTRAYITVARPDIADGWPEREPNQRFTLQMVSGESLPIQKVYLTLTLGQRSLKMWVFVADITNEFILGLAILRAYNASVDIGRQTLRLAEVVSLWSPGAGPHPSSLLVAKDHVIPAQREKIVMARMYYDRETTETPLEEDKLASVDTKPEKTQEENVPVEDAIVAPVRESEEEMMSITREESTACQEEMEAGSEKMEPDSEMMLSVVEHQEVRIQDATVMPVREPEEEMTPVTRKETMACRETTEAYLEEKQPTSLDRKPEVAKREVPNEDSVVKPVKRRKRRHRGKTKAARRREEPKKVTRGICGSRRKLAAACSKVSRRATVARCRRDDFKKERTQNGCQRRLAAARRGTSPHAEVA
jgi:hypothetical protein